MNCSSTEARFERLLEGDLATGQRDAVLAHLDGCAGCRGVLEELRVVDALLTQPREVVLAANFTFATMAEARAMRAPALYRAPVGAYLVSYLAAAWLIAGAAMLLAPQTMHTLVGATLDIARSIAAAVGGLGSVIARLFGRGGNTLTAALGALLAIDILLVIGLGFALRYVRPRLVERLRS
jgi:anti-sigma factor RsiW